MAKPIILYQDSEVCLIIMSVSTLALSLEYVQYEKRSFLIGSVDEEGQPIRSAAYKLKCSNGSITVKSSKKHYFGYFARSLPSLDESESEIVRERLSESVAKFDELSMKTAAA